MESSSADQTASDKRSFWSGLEALSSASDHSAWVAELVSGLTWQWAPWMSGQRSLTTAPLSEERRVIGVSVWALDKAERCGQWSAALAALDAASSMPVRIGRFEFARLMIQKASRAPVEQQAARFESLAGCLLFDERSPWALAEAFLKDEFWPTASGRDEEVGNAMASMLLAKARRPKELSSESMARLATGFMRVVSSFPDEFDWISTGAGMAQAAGRRFLPASKLGPRVFDAWSEDVWLGVRSHVSPSSALGAWAFPKLMAKAAASEALREKLAAIELMRFDKKTLSIFENVFPGVLESQSAIGAMLAFHSDLARVLQIDRVQAAIERPSGLWAKPTMGLSAGQRLVDLDTGQAWARLAASFPSALALLQVAALKKSSAKPAAKRGLKRAPRL